VNPRIHLLSQPEVNFFEGCLSLPGFSAIVPRSSDVVVDCLNEEGAQVRIEAEGWYARILQHEIDHLHGTLYIDRMLSRSFCSLDHYNRYWKVKPIQESLSELANGDEEYQAPVRPRMSHGHREC
jgi:peptide deformylase